MGTVAPFLTPFLLGTGLYFMEYSCASLSRRLILFLGIAISSSWNTLVSPYSEPMLNFLTGIISAWYVIWAGDLLFVQDPHTFKRLRLRTIPNTRGSYDVYEWQTVPKQFTVSRIFWVLDLVTNLRELGWRHGLHKVSPLQEQERNIPYLCRGYSARTKFAFLLYQMKRAVPAYMFMSIYERAPFPAQDWALNFVPRPLENMIHHNISLWAWTIYIYFLLEFTHSVLTLLAVGLLGKRYLGAAGEPWMYPPIFGHAGPFFETWNIQVFWGQWWHNAFRRSLLSIPQKIFSTKIPALYRKLLSLLVSFYLSAYFHAAACYCTLKDTRAAGLILLCFCLQPIPIIVQRFLSQLLAKSHPAIAVSAHCISICIGFCWMSWTLPLAVLNPAVLCVQETFRISPNIRIFD